MNGNYEDGFGRANERKAVDSNLTGAKIETNTRNQVANALMDAENLAFRIKQVIGQLCGFRPEPCEDTSDAGHEGVLPEMAGLSVRTRRQIREAQEEIDRLMSHFE